MQINPVKYCKPKNCYWAYLQQLWSSFLLLNLVQEQRSKKENVIDRNAHNEEKCKILTSDSFRETNLSDQVCTENFIVAKRFMSSVVDSILELKAALWNSIENPSH